MSERLISVYFWLTVKLPAPEGLARQQLPNIVKLKINTYEKEQAKTPPGV